MADYSLITKHKLLHMMKKMSRNSDFYVKRPGKDFSRSRKISFFDTLRFLLSLGAKSLDKELLDFFSYRPDLPTSSAMLQQRGKLKPNTMKVLFSVFTALSPNIPTSMAIIFLLLTVQSSPSRKIKKNLSAIERSLTHKKGKTQSI